MREEQRQEILAVNLSRLQSLFPGITTEEFPILGKTYVVPSIEEVIDQCYEVARGVNSVRGGLIVRYTKAIGKHFVEARMHLLLARDLEKERHEELAQEQLALAQKHLDMAFAQAHVMKTSGVPRF